MATDLHIYGAGGGGSGGNQDTFSSETDAFKWNVARAGKDVCEADGVNRVWVNRMDLAAGYSNSTDNWGAWGGGTNGPIDRAVAIAASTGTNLLVNFHAASPGSAAQVPKITNGVMQSWKTQIGIILSKYAPGGSLGPGSVVTMTDGSKITLPSSWPGILYWEVWNEPNQIGSCGGTLAQGGTSQGRPWYEVVYIMNRDAIAAAKAHPSWGRYKLSAITMGGLETDYLFGGSWPTGTTPNGVVSYGHQQGFDWGQFNSISMHCYYNTDPMLNNGGARGVIDTIRTHIRPQMNNNGASACKIWITEGGHGGSNSPIGSQTEHTNRYQGTGVGLSKTGVSWGIDAHKSSGQVSQPFVIRNCVRKLRQMNTQNNAGVEMYCPHMQFRYVVLDNALATSDDFVYWQRSRCIFENTSADTNKNAYTLATGTPKRSPDWLQAAEWYHDEIMSETGTNVAPDVQITSPANGITTAANSQLVRFSATDDVAVASIEYDVNNGSGYSGVWKTAVLGTAAGPAVTASVTVTIVTSTAGVTNRVKARATDNQAAVSTTIPEITIIGKLGDTTPPTLSVTTPAANATVTNATTTQTVAGTASDASGILSVTVNGVAQTLTSGAFSTTVNLAVGANVITVIARDNASNSTTVTRTITRSAAADTTPPVLTVSNPASNQTVSNATTSQTVAGTTSDAESGITTFTVNGAAVTVSGGSFSTSVNLAVGANTITCVSTNGAGLRTTVTRTVTRQADTTGPTMTLLTAPNSSYNVANTTTTWSMDIRATDPQGIQKVTWSLNGASEVLFVDHQNGLGDYGALNMGPLVVGANTFVYKGYDNAPAHNVTAVSQTINRAPRPPPPDTTPPNLTVSTPSADASVGYATTSQTVAGTVSDNVGVTTLTVNGTSTPFPSNAFSTSVSLAVGTNLITVIAGDAAGNTRSVTRTITRLADQPPTLTVTTPAADATVSAATDSQTVAGTASDPIGLASVTVNGATVTVDGGGNWTTSVSLTTGVNPITIIATNVNGLTTSITRTITRSEGVDVTPPTLTVATPAADGSVSNATTTQSVVGQATDNVAIDDVTVNDVAQTLDGSGNFSTSVSLAVGPNTITVTARDTAGNPITITRTIVREGVVDTTMPVLTVTYPPPTGLTVIGTAGEVITIEGTTTDTESGVDSLIIYRDSVGQTDAVEIPIDASGAFQYEFRLRGGADTFYLRSRDVAGNQNTQTFTVLVQDTAPSGAQVQLSDDLTGLVIRFRRRGF